MAKTFITPEGEFTVAGCWHSQMNVYKNRPTIKPDGSVVFQAWVTVFFDLTLADKTRWQQRSKESLVLETPKMHSDVEVSQALWPKVNEMILQAKKEWAGYIP